MKDVRFYLEFPDRTTKKKSSKKHVGHTGNVIALFPSADESQDALAALFGYSNSPVVESGIARKYLGQCKRIPERLARQIHPRLFERLDAAED